MFKILRNTRENSYRFTTEPTGPDSSRILFYGTKNFERSRPSRLDDPVRIGQLFEESNIYFVRSIRYEAGKDGSFQLSAEHFEDGMLSVYTYRLGPRAGRKISGRFSDTEKLRKAFGRPEGGDVFLRYCRRRWYPVECTTYWC
jgi:hypothetical protein